MIEDARRAMMFGRYYAGGSIALAVGIFIFFRGTAGAIIAIAVLLQGVALAFMTNFWNGFETFVANSTERPEGEPAGERSRAASL